MKIMTTKVREGSVAGTLAESLKRLGHKVYSLPDGKDIRTADLWGPEVIQNDTQVLINTAGITDNAPVGEWDWRRLDAVVSVNLCGAMMITEAFIRATQSCRLPKLIIHMGSAGSRKVFTNGAAYCAAKAGLAHYVECAGYELREKGFSIISIHPDNIQGTPMTKRVQNQMRTERGMSDDQIKDAYRRAIQVHGLADFVSSLVQCPTAWYWMNGENYYLGAGCKRGF